MTIKISHETKTLLADEARRLRGHDIKRFVHERAPPTRPVAARPALLGWHLGSIGPLHRHDIDNDFR